MDVKTAVDGLEKVGWKPTSDGERAWYWLAKRSWEQVVSIGASAVKPLTTVLHDSAYDMYTSQICNEVALALGRIHTVQALTSLVNALGDEREWIRNAAKGALITCKSDDSSERLIAALSRDDILGWCGKNLAEQRLMLGVAEVLGIIKEPLAVFPLIELLNEFFPFESINAQEIVVSALVSIGKPAVVPLLSALSLNDSVFYCNYKENRASLDWDDARLFSWKYWCIEDALEALGEFSFDHCISLLQDMTSTKRATAASILGGINDQRAVVPLIGALGDKMPWVRTRAVYALGRLGDRVAITALVAALEDSDKNVRYAAASTLSLGFNWQPKKDELGARFWIAEQEWEQAVKLGVHAIKPLVKMLRDVDETVREKSAWALIKLNWKPAAEYNKNWFWMFKWGLVKNSPAATYTDNDAIWFWIVKKDWDKLLSASGDVVAPLATLLEIASSDEPYQGAVDGLAHIKDLRSIQALIDHLATYDTTYFPSVVEPLVRIGIPCVEPLISALMSRTRAREAATAALDDIGDSDMVDSLLLVLQDRSQQERNLVARSLETLRNMQDCGSVIARLRKDSAYCEITARTLVVGVLANDRLFISSWRHKQPFVREAYILHLYHLTGEAMRSLSDPCMIQPLIQSLKCSQSSRCLAAYALGRIKDSRAIDPLITALRDDNSNVRLAATEALGKFNGSLLIAPLMHILNDENICVRKAAAESLERLEWQPFNAGETAVPYWIVKNKWGQLIGFGKAAIPPLVFCLKEFWYPKEYEAGVATLLKISAPSVEPIIAVLNTENSFARKETVEALGNIGEARTFELVVEMLQDSEENVRRVAIVALGKFKNPRAIDPLLSVLKKDCKNMGGVIVASLQAVGWKPTSDEVSAWYWITKRDWKQVVSCGSAAVDAVITTLAWRHPLFEVVDAIKALGELEDLRAYEPLVAMLDDYNQLIRQTAIWSLGKLKSN